MKTMSNKINFRSFFKNRILKCLIFLFTKKFQSRNHSNNLSKNNLKY